jgi:hypothetical protein
MADWRGDWLQRLHCTLDRRFNILVSAGDSVLVVRGLFFSLAGTRNSFKLSKCCLQDVDPGRSRCGWPRDSLN